MELGIVGKTPAEPDFVRHGAEGAHATLLRWTWDALASAPSLAMPASGLRFVWHAPELGERALLGVMVPSRDRVGRAFPLIAAWATRASSLGAAWPAAPVAWRDALGTLRAALLRVVQGELSLDRVASIAPPPPHGALQAAAVRARDGWRGATAAEFHERCFGDRDADLACYGHHALQHACAQSAAAELALSCPAVLPSDAALWLELVRALRPASARMPSFAWTVGSDARLLVSPGTPPHELLASACGAAPGARVWPLTTDRRSAIDAARARLGGWLPRGAQPMSALIDAAGTMRGAR